MQSPLSTIQTDFGEPILFRTTGRLVYESTLATGSIWLWSDWHYRELEDKVRSDNNEGENLGTTSIPLRVAPPNGPELNIHGPGYIGQRMMPHYLISMHGSSIAPSQREAFGGYTFGIRSLSRLSVEVLYQCATHIKCTGYRYGQIFYQYVALALTPHRRGSAAIQIGENPPHFLSTIDTDAFRKRPIKPFINQDEWRIAIFTNDYVHGDPSLPLKINVASTHFFPYLAPDALGGV